MELVQYIEFLVDYLQGHDTTASGLCWMLFLLGSHPEVQQKAAEEVTQFFGNML